jgi:hypothetical protein
VNLDVPATGILTAPSLTVPLDAAGPARAQGRGKGARRSLVNSATGPRAGETTGPGATTTPPEMALGATIGAHEAKETAAPSVMIAHAEMIALVETNLGEAEGHAVTRGPGATAPATADRLGPWSVPAHP